MASPTATERLTDASVQGMNLLLAIAGCVVLLVRAEATGDTRHVLALGIYAAGLLAMVSCSALYAGGRDGPRHGLYRQLDRAAIFLMISGTYTPFILLSGGNAGAVVLLAVVWTVALAGVLVILVAPRRLERLSIPLYLLLGWSILSDPGLLGNLPVPVLALLVAGGLFYSLGVVFHQARIAFQEAIWHGFVLGGAACHYVAIASISMTVFNG